MSFYGSFHLYTNEYVFDASNLFAFVGSMLPTLNEDDKSYIACSICHQYVLMICNDILDDKRLSNTAFSYLQSEFELELKCESAEKHKLLINRFDMILGNQIRYALGRNMSFMTHEINSYVGFDGAVSIKVGPSMLSNTEKYNIFLNNIEEEGGYVSTRERRTHDE